MLVLVSKILRQDEISNNFCLFLKYPNQYFLIQLNHRKNQKFFRLFDANDSAKKGKIFAMQYLESMIQGKFYYLPVYLYLPVPLFTTTIIYHYHYLSLQ